MASLGKISVFTGEDYAYWKVRMRAFLQSLGAEVWDITKNQAYEVLAVRTTPLQVTEHEANSKAVNALFAGVSRAEFSRSRVFRKPTKFGRALRTTTRAHLRLRLNFSRLTGVNMSTSHRGRVSALATCLFGFNRL